jgi:glycosyltransferase involved in cell wall biosynthesis
VKCHDPAIIYAFQPNQGPAVARNAGVKLAQGDYIAFCDHDDIWNSRHLEILLGLFSTHPGLALAFDNAEYFGDSRKAGQLHLGPQRSRALSNVPVSPRELLSDYPVASMSVVMVHRAAFDKLGGFNENIWGLDDLHFYLRLGAREAIRYTDYVGCRKRVAENSLSQRINIKEANVRYLADLWRNDCEVVRAIGPVNFKLRLARKYFKLARFYRQNHNRHLAKQMFWNAYKMNFINARYLWHAVSLGEAKSE